MTMNGPREYWGRHSWIIGESYRLSQQHETGKRVYQHIKYYEKKFSLTWLEAQTQLWANHPNQEDEVQILPELGHTSTYVPCEHYSCLPNQNQIEWAGISLHLSQGEGKNVIRIRVRWRNPEKNNILYKSQPKCGSSWFSNSCLPLNTQRPEN